LVRAVVRDEREEDDMNDVRSRRHRSATLALITAGLVATASLLFVGGASAQTVACGAGARGAAGGDGGRSTAGNGGLGFTAGGFSTIDSRGGTPGSARGGDGGLGGSGTLPICNQNTNGDVGDREAPEAPEAPQAPAAAPAPAAPAAAPTVTASQQQQQQGGTGGGGLARTGATTSVQLGLAGLAFALGGMFLFFGAPAKNAILRLVGATPTQAPVENQDWNVLGWSPPFRKDR
jgi:hypothetical protein